MSLLALERYWPGNIDLEFELHWMNGKFLVLSYSLIESAVYGKTGKFSFVTFLAVQGDTTGKVHSFGSVMFEWSVRRKSALSMPQSPHGWKQAYLLL
jgi:hypothetical protein